ncbi:hypothetical protein WA026_005662 [Henosepilachna vigintioctopunctata]|uniref:Uncharacterized protein n=1 Tax=Henosepilachna vigintioctopunctata TaxID=420089 RepID=A0AAW1U4M8_9CUCU
MSQNENCSIDRNVKNTLLYECYQSVFGSFLVVYAKTEKIELNSKSLSVNAEGVNPIPINFTNQFSLGVNDLTFLSHLLRNTLENNIYAKGLTFIPILYREESHNEFQIASAGSI